MSKADLKNLFITAFSLSRALLHILIVSKNGADGLAVLETGLESQLPTVHMHSQSLEVIGIKGGGGN